MVKIAVAGGSGQVAKEVIDALLASGKHEISILSRNEAPSDKKFSGLDWRVVDYNKQTSLVENLLGIHTLLSFVQIYSDPEGILQKQLIDAAIIAGVKRFAPSEYGSASMIDMPWWTGKESTREYLKKVNENGKILQYTLFQPGLFLNYLAFPQKTAKHVDPLQSVFDYQNCRAIVVDGHEDAIMTLTTVADVAAVVARTVDYEGEWPEIGGISGNRVTFGQIIEIGEQIRGQPFTIERVKMEDLEAGILKTTWTFDKRHEVVSEEQFAAFVKILMIGILLSTTKGAWNVSNELNQLFPDYQFDKMEDFLSKVWHK